MVDTFREEQSRKQAGLQVIQGENEKVTETQGMVN